MPPHFRIEKSLHLAGHECVVGVDEAGRGCLAGPVVAAAVVLPVKGRPRGLDDSKLLPPEKREKLYQRILSASTGVGIGICTPGEIDRWNILSASLEAMNRAIKDLGMSVDRVLVDGNRAVPGYACRTIIKGDSISQSIAAASIIAKVSRDRMMADFARRYPEYSWETNKGYPTKEHYRAINRKGICGLHRKSFTLIKSADDPWLLF